MKKIFIHDDGSLVCADHAWGDLKSCIEQEPRKRIHWTPRGTWELAPKNYAEEFERETGFKFECETCQTYEERAI